MLPFPLIGRFSIQLFCVSRMMASRLQLRLLHLILMGALQKPRIGADKWSLPHKSIPEKLQRPHNNGYKLVIFTNEPNIERWKNRRQQAVDSKVGRLDNFIECVKVPIRDCSLLANLKTNWPSV